MRKVFLVALALPALFAPRPGWHTGHGAVHSCPGVAASRCVQATSWAATVPWRGCGACLPHDTIAALPQGGVALQVTVAVERPARARRAVRWPPTIRARDIGAGFEGVSRRYGVYQLFARSGASEVYVWAFFGRAHPSARRVAAANAELRTVRLRRAPARDPWQLHCASMPRERTLPAPVRRDTLRFFPWIRPAAKGLRAGPVVLVALSSRSSITRDGDVRDSGGYYLHRALFAISPAYGAALAISGRRLGAPARRTVLGFSTDGANTCTVRSPVVSCGTRPLRFDRALRVPRGTVWRIVRSELRIGRTGCFRVDVRGRGLHRSLPLAVPGPDYGTPGW